MNSFEINKILGALLGTCLVLLAVHIASGAIFTPPVPAKPGYEITVKAEQPGQGKGEAAPVAQPIENLLASASVEHGAQLSKQCQICHNLKEGQGPKSRSRSVRCCRPAGRIGRKFPLHGSVEKAGRQLDLRCAKQMAD